MTVTTTDVGSGRLVCWDRRANLNAWDLETMTAIADAIEAAGEDEAVRCVILRGAGEHFSAGDDLHAARAATKETWAETIDGFQRLTRVVMASPVPAVAAVDGVCVGGALEFSASCDVRVCTDRIRILTPETRIGFVLSNAGSFFLPHVLGETAARELLLTGEERDAAWARARGFATEMVAAGDLDAAVERWVARFDATSRTAVAATRRLLNERWGDLLDAALEREARWCVDLFDTPDASGALSDFAGRRGA
jgi:enoyl-CoA hydratase/carnithine racemase